jgi:cytoskeletal protein RodZ
VSRESLKRRIVLCVITGALVVGAACGGGGSDVQKGVEDTSTTAPSTTSTEAPSTTATQAPTTTTRPPTTTTRQAPTTTTTEAPAASGPVFANCTEAKAAGYQDIHRGEPGYSTKLDRDGDGVACES